MQSLCIEEHTQIHLASTWNSLKYFFVFNIVVWRTSYACPKAVNKGTCSLPKFNATWDVSDMFIEANNVIIVFLLITVTSF